MYNSDLAREASEANLSDVILPRAFLIITISACVTGGTVGGAPGKKLSNCVDEQQNNCFVAHFPAAARRKFNTTCTIVWDFFIRLRRILQFLIALEKNAAEKWHLVPWVD